MDTKTEISWKVSPCGLYEVYLGFGKTCYISLHFCFENGSSRYL